MSCLLDRHLLFYLLPYSPSVLVVTFVSVKDAHWVEEHVLCNETGLYRLILEIDIYKQWRFTYLDYALQASIYTYSNLVERTFLLVSVSDHLLLHPKEQWACQMCHQDEILEYSTKRDVSLYQQTVAHSYIFTLHIPRLMLDYWKIVCSRLHIDWMRVLFVWWLHSPTIWRCPMFAGWICNLLNKEKARYIFF